MKKYILLSSCLLFFLCDAAFAQPSITTLSSSTLTRSGRLVIQGSGFGASQGASRVEIGGVNALISRWSDTLIAAYVPETTPEGTVTVQVVVDGMVSNALLLTVTLRLPDGRVKWRFQADSDYIFQRPAVGSDGTIVAHDSGGFVYALTPDGGLKWIFKTPLSAYGPPSIGADGTVYVASSSTIYAIDANGVFKWSFTEPQGGQGIIAGPTVGPDGNIYAVSDIAGLGAFSLAPTGKLLWSNPGNPVINQLGQLGVELVFGSSQPGGQADQFYFACDDAVTSPMHILYAFRMTGSQAWTVPLFMSKDSFMQGQSQPAVGGDGAVFVTAVVPTGGQWSLNAFSPSNGSLLRSFFPSPGNGISAPDIAVDGTAYLAHSLSYLQGVNPNGTQRWQFFDGSIFQYPIVSPANDLVFVGGSPNFGMPGFVRGFSTASGQLLWTINFGIENGGNLVMQSRPRFSATGNAVYFGTVIAGGDPANPYCYLYAVDTAGAAPAPVLSSLTLSPSSVIGGNAASGQVTLSAPAPVGGMVISLFSSNPVVASVPASVTVPAGTVAASFSISTNSVTANTPVTISANSGGVTKTAILTVMPPPASDSVSIQTAEYVLSKKQLRVQASSSNPAATLKAYVTSSGVLIGTLSNQRNGKYQGQFTWLTNPVNITVRSNLGGAASRNVTLK